MICCPFTFTAARPTMGALNYLPLNSILPHRSYSLYRPAGVSNRVNNKASNKLREARWGSKPRTPVELNKLLHLLFPILLCTHLYVFLFADFIFAKARRIRPTSNRGMRHGLLITYRRASKQFCLNMGLLLIVEMSGEILRWRREERTSAELLAMRTNNFAAVCVLVCVLQPYIPTYWMLQQVDILPRECCHFSPPYPFHYSLSQWPQMWCCNRRPVWNTHMVIINSRYLSVLFLEPLIELVWLQSGICEWAVCLFFMITIPFLMASKYLQEVRSFALVIIFKLLEFMFNTGRRKSINNTVVMHQICFRSFLHQYSSNTCN